MSEKEIKEEVKEEKEEKKKKKKDVVSELEEKYAELNEKYLYALAQMKDLHKTYEKENAIAIKYVTYDLMEELLPILDIFTMVLEGANVPDEIKAYLKGFELVYTQFKMLLERHGVSEISCKEGDKFDHNIHNGVEKIEDDSKEKDTIACVLQRGYKIQDKVLRPVSCKVYTHKEKKEEVNQEAEVDLNKGE